MQLEHRQRLQERCRYGRCCRICLLSRGPIDSTWVFGGRFAQQVNDLSTDFERFRVFQLPECEESGPFHV